MLAFVSIVLVLVGIFSSSLRPLKAFHFLCGEFLFATTVAFGCLAVLEASSFIWTGIGFFSASWKFAYAAFLTKPHE